MIWLVTRLLRRLFYTLECWTAGILRDMASPTIRLLTKYIDCPAILPHEFCFRRENSAPGEIRTPDHLVRSQVLYPAELRAQFLILLDNPAFIGHRVSVTSLS